MTTFTELFIKLSQLGEGDMQGALEADVMVGELLVPEPRMFNLTHRVLRNGKPPCPFFTQSVDEVLKLVPEGYALTVTQLTGDGEGKAILWKDSWDDNHKATSGVYGPNCAVAGLIAIVEYRVNLEMTDDHPTAKDYKWNLIRQAVAGLIPMSTIEENFALAKPTIKSETLPESKPFLEETQSTLPSNEPWYSEQTQQVDTGRYKVGGLINFTGSVMDVAMEVPCFLMIEYSKDIIVHVQIGDEFEDRVDEIMDTFGKTIAVQVEVKEDFKLGLKTIQLLP